MKFAYFARALTDARCTYEKVLLPAYADGYFAHEYNPDDIHLNDATSAYALGAVLTAQMLQEAVPSVCPPFGWEGKAVKLAKRVEKALTRVYEAYPTPKAGTSVTQAIMECMTLVYSESTPTRAIEVLLMPMEYPQMNLLAYVSGVVETLHSSLMYTD